MRVGVLALQGAFREHVAALRSLEIDAVTVRDARDLETVDAVILPGGESTTMDKLLRKFHLQAPLREHIAGGMPVLATCAGLILLARVVEDGIPDQESLGLLDVRVRRNGYGRQPDSFEADLHYSGLDAPFHGIFIRAPVIEDIGDGVEILASVDGAPVAVRAGAITALAFHPELSGDPRIHGAFAAAVVPVHG